MGAHADDAAAGQLVGYVLAQMTDVALPVQEAAAVLGVPPARVREWLRNGAPTVRAGHRGRGGAALVDVVALRRWRQQREQPPAEDPRTTAHNLVGSLAGVLVTRWRLRSDPGKLRDAAAVVTEFVELAAAVHDQLGLPELSPSEWPDTIKQMSTACDIFGTGGKTGSQ